MGNVTRPGMGLSSRAPVRWLQRKREGELYRGQDRRGVVVADATTPGPVFVVAGLGLLTLVVTLLAGRAAPAEFDELTVSVLLAQLDAGGFAVSLLLAALCFVRWRLVGEAAVLWLGTAAAIFALFTVGLGYVQAIAEATGNTGLLLLHPASRAVVIGLVVCALLSPEVDATLRPSRIVASALALVAIATVALQLLPTTGAFAAGSAEAIGGAGTAIQLAAMGSVAVWGALGVWSMWVGLHARHIFAWFGLLFFALAFARMVWLVPTDTGSIGMAGPSLLQGYGLLCAVLGATSELSRAYVKQGSKLLDSVTCTRAAEARIEVELATQAEREHEAVNALAAIEGATLTLQRYQDRLDPQAREQLAEAVSGEVHRLQQLVRVAPAAPVTGRFRLTEAFAAVITCARWEGATVAVDIPDHLVALGQPAETTQVLQNLLHNASRYAGGHIVVRGLLQDDRVVIRVEDEGPGILPDERESIFTRGVRGRASGDQPGSGLGLYISSRLMHQQGGDIHVEESPSGGASFVVSLPGFSELAANDGVLEQTLDHADEVGEFALETRRAVLLFPHHRKRRTRGIEDEHGFRDYVAR
jgi:signal transduction histidine kinase